MKRVLLIIMVLFFLSGCSATVRETGFFERDTHFRSWEHMKFSLWGYHNPTKADVEMSKKEDWWGQPVKVGK